MMIALAEIDEFPKNGYEGRKVGETFVITHPELNPVVQLVSNPYFFKILCSPQHELEFSE